MFKHPGKKLMKLAVVVLVLGCLLFIGLGAVIGLYGSKLSGLPRVNPMEFIVIGAAVAVLGVLCSWISALALYAYGSLVDKTRDNNYMLSRIAAHTKEIVERMGNYSDREMNIDDDD